MRKVKIEGIEIGIEIETGIEIEMKMEEIGNVLLYCQKGADLGQQALDEDSRKLQEIVQSYQEEDYHSQVTACKNWTVMYQLAESRANIIEWIKIPRQAKVLELGAGCGTVTSSLLKKGAYVTCQEENLHYCKLNALRHKQVGERELAIYAMPFAECEASLGQDYDMAVLLDLPLGWEEAKRLLRSLRGHLKKDGLLAVAAKNKFGLKYWAGNQEPHTHRYFAGLENDGVRMYSGSGLKELLKEAGFAGQEFYYPYPDERFTLDVYSDRHLPKKGDLTYNIANYEGDRILLFDEQKVYDSIIEEGQFPFFSNAYLCLAKMGQEACQGQEDIYVRYASDRSRAHAICTEITDGQVYKRAMYPEGAAHVAHILQAYGRLSQQYRDTDLRFNRCEPKPSADGAVVAEFELLHAQALQEQIEQAVAVGQMEKVFGILRRMVQYIRSGSGNVPFEMTDAFRDVFGEITDGAALCHAACSEVSDIDLILPNILVGEDGAWNVIDYEWTFFFPIPQNFIIYRTLFFLSHENPQQEALAMGRLLELMGITPEEAGVYAQMEERFQQYVTGGLVPYREMVNLLERRFFNIVELKADYDRIVAQNELLKGQGIWKVARKIKKKLTGN